MSFDFYNFFFDFYKCQAIYISDEIVQILMARQRDDLIDGKLTFHRTTALHATPHYKPLHFTELSHT